MIWGLPILSSDAISSVAYAGQEMLAVLLPAVGILAYGRLTLLSGVIIALLLILTLSYRQTIDCYPGGGGAYTVARENLGTIWGIIAGAALSVGYILTVAVSISSGIDQITSAFVAIRPYRLFICVGLIALIAVANLRGLREAARIFGIPTYAFILGMLVMLVYGFIKIGRGYTPIKPTFTGVMQPVTTLLLIRAFSSGCAALTGVEAVSNGVPNFREPAQKNAKSVLALLSLIILVLFGSTAILANMYYVVPGEQTMLTALASQIFGGGFMYYYVTVTTFIILIFAANTAYSGFPVLISVMSADGYMPRKLSSRGNRLSFDSGIILLSAAAAILIVVFNADVGALIGLYAIGIFISFTLSQAGMLRHWIRDKSQHWHIKAAVNGIGMLATAIVVVIIAITKFRQGAWIVLVVIPLIVLFMLRIKDHYSKIRAQLHLGRAEREHPARAVAPYNNRVIVPIESVNRASVRALRYARTISDNVTAFNVVLDDETGEKNRKKFAALETDIPLVVKYSPYRAIVEPLMEFIESAEYDLTENDMVSVILPQFMVEKFWHRLLHNNTRVHIERRLLKHRQIAVCTIPLQLSDKEAEPQPHGPDE